MNPKFSALRNKSWIPALAVLGAFTGFLAPRALPAQSIPASQIPGSQLIQPDALHRDLQSTRPPLVLQVGSKLLFNEAHIPGAEYAGPASRPEGLAALRSRVAGLPRHQAIVIYCGCCPWTRCPNIGPAWHLLRQMGFTHVRALYIADNFGADWVDKGYPAKGAQ